MGAELRIDDPAVVALATELAELTGQSVAQVIDGALRDRLDRERRVQERKQRILATAAELRAHMRHPLPSSDHSDLYGEDGLAIGQGL